MADERPRVDHHKPPFSRVFVVCSRSHTEEDLRSAFEEYGEVNKITSKSFSLHVILTWNFEEYSINCLVIIVCSRDFQYLGVVKIASCILYFISYISGWRCLGCEAQGHQGAQRHCLCKVHKSLWGSISYGKATWINHWR